MASPGPRSAADQIGGDLFFRSGGGVSGPEVGFGKKIITLPRRLSALHFGAGRWVISFSVLGTIRLGEALHVVS